MALYITRCALEINGSSVTDFKGFTEKAITQSKRVNLMYKSGNANLTKRYDIDLDYVENNIYCLIEFFSARLCFCLFNCF
jgi:hypothetical protein